MPVFPSRIFPSDVSSAVREPADNNSVYRADDVTILHVFNKDARGVKHLSSSLASKAEFQDFFMHLGREVLVSNKNKLRIGVVGVEGTGKTTAALAMLSVEPGLPELMADKLKIQGEWKGEHADDYPIAETESEKLGHFVLVDLFSILSEDLAGVTQQWVYGEIQRSAKEVEALARADLAIIEHPDANVDDVSQESLEDARDDKGYDMLVFSNQVQGSDERHAAVVVPRGGVLEGRFSAFQKKVMARSSALLLMRDDPSL